MDSVLDRAKLYTDESVISSTESHLTGYTTDWANEKVYNLRSGEELTLEQAVERGILDGKQVSFKLGSINNPLQVVLITYTHTASASLPILILLAFHYLYSYC